MNINNILSQSAIMFHVENRRFTVYEQRVNQPSVQIDTFEFSEQVGSYGNVLEAVRDLPQVKALIATVNVCIISTSNQSLALPEGVEVVKIDWTNIELLNHEPLHFNIVCVFNTFLNKNLFMLNL
ncbi:MAG: hypothetical protein SP4CHLAM5_11470 [Chlamydiia bacterium]|nr:hypothetical protein [Chlamydiia bacterium]MCH9619003.1 hypothetical protein [Chlamydiia bacterium]MCH9624636.1 hypothetical protein [Chlamydiia bacterium]